MAPGLIVPTPGTASAGDSSPAVSSTTTHSSPAVPPTTTRTLADLTSTYTTTLRFYLNGTPITLPTADPEITLLEYLRGIGLTGTKLGCAEGGCGACTVVISQFNPTTRKIYHASVNACLAPLVSVDGKHVVTVEGIGNVGNAHAVQERIARGNGSQCGFCTPGIVMSLYAVLRNCDTGVPGKREIEEAFDGNLCRCTGYRSILDAAQTFSVKGGGGGGCGKVGGCCMDKDGGGGGGGCGVNDDEPIKRFTPPGFIPYNPDTQLIFPPALRNHTFHPLAFGTERKKWFRPVTLPQLLELKSAYPSAKIIAGSTETQIEIKFKGMNYSVSVFVGDIAELRQFSFHEEYVEIGGNVVLTDLEKICEDAVAHYGSVRGQPFATILKQIRYFAGRQIRNVGTPAGNLATASPISDLNPVFVATGATLVARSLGATTEIAMRSFFTGYRQTALPADAIIASLRIPVARAKGEFIRAYKQSKRKDDDIAIVNAALRVALDDGGVVESVDLVYGGMAPTTIGAKKAEEFLKGKKFSDLGTLEGVMDMLEEDFDLRFGVPGGMATYRKSLALSFFYKFYHEVLAELHAEEVDVDTQAIGEIERDISSGEKDGKAADAYKQKEVGQSKNHVAAMKQCTGEAQYTDDIPLQRNELYGALVLSTKPHAKLLSVDASPALDLPGVVAYVDHNDLASPEANWWGAPSCDETFFAIDEVFTVGQPIGMILADTAKHAEQAARAVSISYADLPAIFTIEEAIQQDSYFNHFRHIQTGDTEAAFAEADHVFTGTVRMGGQEHFYLETNACIAIPHPEDGAFEIHSSTQNPAETQAYVAKVLGVAANKVVTRVKRMGGGFGGKETRSIQLAGIVACAAKKVRRPVRCMLNRDDDIATSGQRHPFLTRYKIGVLNSGRILALDADVFCNGGWSQDLSGAVVERALSHIDGCYAIANVHVRGRVAKTNTVSNTAFRGFGGPQGLFVAETYVEEVADWLGMSAERVREVNMYGVDNGMKTHFNQDLKDWYVPLMYKQVQEESSYAQRRAEITSWNSQHKWNKRGLALIPTKFGISFTALFLNQAGALVHIYHDGSILLAHGGTEMGQGLHTKMSQIAAEALRVPLSSVHISETATNTVANASSTAASASSDLNGYAIYNACEVLNERLAPFREKLGDGASMKDLAHAAYFARVNLSAQGFYKTPDIGTYPLSPSHPHPTPISIYTHSTNTCYSQATSGAPTRAKCSFTSRKASPPPRSKSTR